MTDMKIMQVKDSDICSYGDFLSDDKSLEFANGGFTHIQYMCDGEICMNECEMLDPAEFGIMVSVGLQVDINKA